MTPLVFSFVALAVDFGSMPLLRISNLMAVVVQNEDTAKSEDADVEDADQPESEFEKLKSEQSELFEKYKLLEEKLFTLHEFEKTNNPTRSKLLERAYIQSQERLTTSQLKLIVNLLTKSKLKDAQSEQDEVLTNLNQLLELLQSEDRGKRVRDSIQRNQAYLKEVERILRIQKGIRGQTAGGVDAKRLANSQEKLAQRANQLQDEMKIENGDAPADSPPSSPAQKRIQSAEQRMREAQQSLENAQRNNAIEAMRNAEREMALAKKELEEILRQLREEEVERTLAVLEGRFREMLERQVRVHESTRKLEQVVTQQRGTEFEIRSGKIAVEQNLIATMASGALMILREDGSSVAFPATVEEMHQDMLQVWSRLSAAKVGKVTIEIEADIIETLDYLIKALVKTQQDMESTGQQSQQQGQPGDQPLVDRLAEIKMLRGLQDRIFRRHRRYSKFLDDPEDLIGSTDDPELQAALQRLAQRQAQLTKIARDIVNEKNK